MALAFRKIDRKPLWTKTPEADEKVWLRAGELQADALGELKTERNKLSIYFVNDNAGVTVERIVAAFAARRERIVKFDYITFDSSLLTALELRSENTPGDTPDSGVNDNHVDLIQLTATKLTQLGMTMQQQGVLNRKLDQQVGRLINIGLAAGHIDRSQVSGDILRKLGEPRFQAAK